MYPILFKVGPLCIYSYGFMIALGVCLSIWLINKRILRTNVDEHFLIDCVFILLVIGIIGARLFYIALNFENYKHSIFSFFKVWEGGLIVYGGVVAATIALIGITYASKRAFFDVADALIPFVALTQGFGRVGCFLNGCCWGKVTTSMWGVTFPFLDMPVHPVQIYESLYCFMMFFLLWMMSNKKKFNGQIAFSYFMLYSGGRFFLEFVRGDQENIFFILNRPQCISLVILLCVCISYYLRKQKGQSG